MKSFHLNVYFLLTFSVKICNFYLGRILCHSPSLKSGFRDPTRYFQLISFYKRAAHHQTPSQPKRLTHNSEGTKAMRGIKCKVASVSFLHSFYLVLRTVINTLVMSLFVYFTVAGYLLK